MIAAWICPRRCFFQVDEAATSPGPDQFLAELGGRLLADRLPPAGNALTLAVPRIRSSPAAPGCGERRPGPCSRPWASPAVRSAKPGTTGWPSSARCKRTPRRPHAGSRPVLSWAGTRPFDSAEAGRLRQVARFVATPLAALATRATMAALLEAETRPAQCRPGAGRCAPPRHRKTIRAPRCSMPTCATSPPCPGDRARGDDRRPRRLVRPRRPGQCTPSGARCTNSSATAC